MINCTINNRVTSPFSWRYIGGRMDFHNGVDYGAKERGVAGDAIFSVTHGIVRVAKDNPNGFGLYVVIEHKVDDQTFCSLYAHLESYKVQVGDIVKEGAIIGYMGSTGHSTGVHCHHEIRNCEYKDFFEKWSNREPKHTVNPILFKLSLDHVEIDITDTTLENIKLKQLIKDINKLSDQEEL